MAKNSLIDTLDSLKRPSANNTQQTQTQQTQPQAQRSWSSNPLLTGVTNSGRRANRTYNILSQALSYKQVSPQQLYAKGEQTHQERLARQEEYDRQLKEQQKAIHDFGKPNLFSSDEERATFKKLTEDYEKTKAEKKAFDKEMRKGIDWEGRDELIKEYKKLHSWGVTKEDAAREEELRKEIATKDAIYGNGDRAYGFTERAQNAISSAGKGIASAVADWGSDLSRIAGEAVAKPEALGTGALGVNMGKAVLQETDPEAFAANQQAKEEQLAPLANNILDKSDAMYEVARQISESSARDLARAKEGLNALGRAGVDVGVNILQMAFDAGMAAVTGGSALGSMFFRAGGNAIGEARENGAPSGAALLYGVSVGSVEALTEKMFDGLAGIYGKGFVSEDIVESLVRRLGHTPTGQTVLRMLTGAAGEALEEVVSGIADPVLRGIYTGEVKYEKKDLEELLYSAAIGFAIGFMGGGTQIMTGQNRAANAENAAMSAIYEQAGTPGFRQEVRDRGILNNLQSNPNYYQNMGVEENAEDAMHALNGGTADATRATQLQIAAAQAAEAEATAREKANGVVRNPEKGTVSRNGIEIKMPRSAVQNSTFILLAQFSAEEAADVISKNKAYQEAFTEMTGLDLAENPAEAKSQIEALFTRTDENASQSEDNSDHTETPAEGQNAQEQAPDELNNQSGEEAEQNAPKGPRIGPKRGKVIADNAYETDVQQMQERRAAEKEDGTRADITMELDEDVDFADEANRHGREIDASLEEQQRAREQQGRRQSARERARQAFASDSQAQANEVAEEKEVPVRADIEADESWDAAEEAAIQRELDRQRRERKREGKLTDEDKAYYRERAEAVRSKDTNKRLPKLAEWAKKWANKWKPKKSFPGDKVAYHAQLADAIQSFADGLSTAQDLFNAYSALNSEDASANSKYFYEGDVAANLKNLAELGDEISWLVNNNTDENTSELLSDKLAEYERLCENTIKNLQTKLERLQEQYENRNELAWQLSMEARVTGHGSKQQRATTIQRYLKTQSRIDTFFRFLGGFNKLGSKAWYKLADRAVDAERRFITIGYNARSYFYQIQSQSPELAKAWSQLESGKLMGNVAIPGIGKLSLNYELSLLRTLETPGGITHIAGHGAELAHEGDYYAGKNNNGWGNKQEDHEMIRDEDIRALAEPYLKAADPDHPTFEEWQAAKEKALENLRDELKKDVMSFDIGKAAYKASQEMAKYMALEINKVSTRMFGYEKALNKDYYPLEEAASGNNAKSMSERVYNMDEPDFLKPRNRESTQALKVTPFAETMMSYIQEASNWCAFGEMWSDLQMLDKSADNAKEHPTITGMIGHAYGEYASKYLGDWERVISNNRPKTSYANRLLGQIRKNIAQASLTLNPGVALKQTPSYYAAAGVIDMDILIKSRIMTGGPFRTARSYRNNPIVNEVNSRSGIVANRLAGYNTIEQGESLEATRSIGQKVMSKLPKWMTNWITGRDVSTVSNLAVACAEQVKRDNPNLKVGSDEYYDAVTALLEEVVVKSQPIYDPQFRAEMLRSDSELLRSLAMFKTQPSQDFNQLYTAIGEYRAMKNATSEEGKAEAKAAKERLQKTIAGQIVAKAAFSALTMLADLITHRTKKYKWSSKDEKKDPEHREGEWAARKFLTRFIFGTASSAASILWFGDTVAAIAADMVTGTNPFAEDTTEFYSISESTTALINDVVKAGITMAQTIGNPDRNGWQKAKAIKELVAKAASTLGISFQNAYNIVNTIVMYELDTDQTKNFDHNDDFMRSMSNYSQMTDTNIANKTMERVVQDYKKGKLSEAETLLAALNFDSNSIVSNVKSDVKSAYIAGDLTEAQTRKLLKDYCHQSAEDIEKLFEDANRQIEYDKAKATNEKAFEAVETLLKSVTDKRRDDERPRDYYEVDAIVGSLLSDKEKDVVVGKNLSATYRTNYNALRGTGMKPTDVTKFLETVDTDANGRLNQDEMYNWYLLHKGDEKSIKALWDAQGYEGEGSKTWADFKESRKNMTYDQLSAERANDPKFVKLEEAVKELKDKNSWMMQNADSDPAIFDKISSMGLSDENFDAAVTKYVSSNGRKMYNAARSEGLSPKQSLDVIRGIDAYYQPKKPDAQNNNYLSVVELVAYYRDHPEQEDVIKALYYATTTSSKSWEEQKAKTKTAGVTAGK